MTKERFDKDVIRVAKHICYLTDEERLDEIKWVINSLYSKNKKNMYNEYPEIVKTSEYSNE